MVGTNEDAWAKRAEASDGEMSKFERSMVPKSARISIPLKHSRALRRYAQELISLANRLEFLSHRSDMTERAILAEAHHAVRVIDHRINPLKDSNVVPLPKQ